MLAVYNDPGNVSVGRVQTLCLKGIFIHYLVSLHSVRACRYDRPIQTIFSRTGLSLGLEVSCIILQAQHEGQSFRFVWELSDCACLNHIALALFHSMLASERPAASIL